MTKGDENMPLVNITEMVARDRLMQLLTHYDCCKCEKCISDMLAIALNSLKPQYVSTRKGELFKRVDSSHIQYTVDLDIALTKAIELVSSNPHH